jgi:hypothetical protein
VATMIDPVMLVELWYHAVALEAFVSFISQAAAQMVTGTLIRMATALKNQMPFATVMEISRMGAFINSWTGLSSNWTTLGDCNNWSVCYVLKIFGHFIESFIRLLYFLGLILKFFEHRIFLDHCFHLRFCGRLSS